MCKDRDHIREYIGNEDQLMTFHEGILMGGFAEGVHFMEIHNGGNLSVTVLPGRCMDVYQVRYKGQNMNYISASGITGASYYDARGNKWLRSFFAGMLTTLGLQNIGRAYTLSNGEEVGQHGCIANCPAQNTKYTRSFENNVPALSVEGTMLEASFASKNLTLHRKIDFQYRQDTIRITDTITNHGFTDIPIVYGLHLNYGYPLLDEDTVFLFDAERTVARNEPSERYITSCHEFEAPNMEIPSMEYAHWLRADEKGLAGYTVFNKKRKIGVKVTYKLADFPYCNEWKTPHKGEYIAAIEPSVVDMGGPHIGQPDCVAPILHAGESRVFYTELTFIDTLI